MMHIQRKLIANILGVARACGFGAAIRYLGAMLVTAPEALRNGTLAAADFRMTGRDWSYRLQGVQVDLPGRYFPGAREMYCRQVYFPNRSFQLRPRMTVLDLGANTGLFSLLAGRVGCRVVAVEAQWGFVQESRELVARNDLASEVVIEHALLGSGGMIGDAGEVRHASHFGGRYPSAMTIGELFKKHDVDVVDFMKIDIEGSEFALLSTENEWLAQVERIAMELHPAYGDVTVLYDTITRHGFQVELRDESLTVVEAVKATYLHARRVGRTDERTLGRASHA